MKFKLLNALLRLQNFLVGNNGDFPPAEELAPHLSAARDALAARMDALRASMPAEDGDNLLSLVYDERFNLRPQDHFPLPGDSAPRAEEKQSATLAWGMCCRFLLTAGAFYAFEQLRDGLYLFVAETKSVPNRTESGPGQCVGRPLVVCFFERRERVGDGVLVEPCAGAQAPLVPPP